MDKKPNILFLASWYPSRVDAFDGDFIQRHAVALASFVNLKVIAVKKDKDLIAQKFELIRQNENGVDTIHAYYRELKSPLKWLNQMVSFIRYFTAFKKAYSILKQENFTPDVVHCNVLMKSGLLGWWLKFKNGIPFVLSEHWSIFLPENGNYKQNNFIYKWIAKTVAQAAVVSLPVSNYLKKCLEQHQLLGKNTSVIPNVADTSLFHFKEKNKTGTQKIIHISTLKKIKNVAEIISAFEILQKELPDAELHIVGGGENELQEFQQHRAHKKIIFYGTISYELIPKLIEDKCCLVLFSDYETLSCVAIEALCSGLPVVASNVGGLPDLITNKNGILVEQGNVQQLVEQLKQMLTHLSKYDNQKISADAIQKYSYDTVGKSFLEIYRSILSNK